MNKVTPRFDCELPPEVRAELLPPRRPRILQLAAVRRRNRRRPRHPWFSIALAFAIPAVLVIASIFAILSRPPLSQTPPAPTPTPTPAALSTAFSEAPLLVSSPNDERFFPSEVRRAERVGLEVRMPYGEVVRIRILGTLPDQESLPLTGNHIGDTYHVGDFEFTWVAPGGIGQWVDP